MLTNIEHNIGIICRGKKKSKSLCILFFFCIVLLALIIGKILPAQFLLREYAEIISTWISETLIIFIFCFFNAE